MQGENWSFRKDTVGYLRTHEMVMDAAHPVTAAQGPAVYNFDLRRKAAGATVVRFAADRPAAERQTFQTHLVRAHWLPSDNDATTVCQIDGTADYFFTVDLSGCRITVTPGPYRRVGTNYPTVRHIGGGMTLADRNLATAAAVNAVPAARQALARSYSIGSGITYNNEAFIMGFKTFWGVWEFWSRDDDPGTGNPRIRRIYP